MRNTFPLSLKQKNASMCGKKIFANSIPKAGTNLLKSLFHNTPDVVGQWTYQLDQSCSNIPRQLATVRKGQVVCAHLPWSVKLNNSLKKSGLLNFLIVRDLRDIAVSNAFYILEKDKDHRLHSYFNNLPSFDECLSASILGIKGYLLKDGVDSKSIGEHFNSYLPWLDEPDCLVVRFEDLIGAKGGGCDIKQKEVVGLIMEHMNISVDDNGISKLANTTFSSSARTFRKGMIGDWRNHFTEKHTLEFKEVAGEALIKMGYENSHDW